MNLNDFSNFVIIQLMFSAITCSKPPIDDATITPDQTTVGHGESYTVSCNTGYSIPGSGILLCVADNTFDQTIPTCQGLLTLLFF